MKVLKKEKLNIHLPLQNNFYIIVFLIFSNFLFSQKFDDYYLTTKIVTFKNPILVVPNYDKVGIFIMESEDFENEPNIKKLFVQKKAFLFDTDSFETESIFDRKNLNYKYQEYKYNSRKEEGKLISLKLDEKIKSFYVGFIKLRYYNSIDASAHSRYPYIKNTDNYEIVLIPSFIE
ncbi:hypothetical protein HNP24_003861 [Chryseobacterium sediminis]|uniref:DUF5103 domain-containing protein n=1 Tax=Chryseobacterium sediminis TaxID=1679494 RepID=A0ABR6Q4G5_9FLAO|nr:hypothetical protein [Chryseobacterium sediminis]MBB6332858.1 hypothetical protein [Chryseobacterium sediminis]